MQLIDLFFPFLIFNAYIHVSRPIPADLKKKKNRTTLDVVKSDKTPFRLGKFLFSPMRVEGGRYGSAPRKLFRGVYLGIR